MWSRLFFCVAAVFWHLPPAISQEQSQPGSLYKGALSVRYLIEFRRAGTHAEVPEELLARLVRCDLDEKMSRLTSGELDLLDDFVVRLGLGRTTMGELQAPPLQGIAARIPRPTRFTAGDLRRMSRYCASLIPMARRYIR